MSAKYINTIEAASTPVYGWFLDFWDQADWVKWHEKLEAMYGLDEANKKFLVAWNSGLLLQAHFSFRNSAFAGNYEFINYAKSHDFYDGLFAGFLGSLFKVQSSAVSVVSNVAGAVDDAATSARDFSKYFIPVLVIIGLIFAYLYSKKHKLI